MARSCVEPTCSAPVSGTAVATAAGRVRDAKIGEPEDKGTKGALHHTRGRRLDEALRNLIKGHDQLVDPREATRDRPLPLIHTGQGPDPTTAAPVHNGVAKKFAVSP
jgi:hypothetical protein